MVQGQARTGAAPKACLEAPSVETGKTHFATSGPSSLRKLATVEGWGGESLCDPSVQPRWVSLLELASYY